jgi:hypothetical protein
MSKQKTKGSSWEREVAKYLSNTYNESFIRNLSGSGSYVGGKNISRKSSLTAEQIRHTRGDIIVPESFNLLNCECKSYSKFPFNLLLSNECKQLEIWLNQLVTSGDENSVNCLFMKITRVGKFIAVEKKYDWDLKNHTVYTSPNYNGWIISDMDIFFASNKNRLKYISEKKE